MSEPLSQPGTAIPERHGILIVGSGYGGAVTAARLAKLGHAVSVVERGREWRPGSFPDATVAWASEMRTDARPGGLYDYQVVGDAAVLTGNGLGGGSLINANVVIEPGPEVFESPRWPAVIREEARQNTLKGYYERVRQVIRPEVVPADKVPPKAKAHLEASRKAGRDAGLLNLAVHFGDKAENAAGVVMEQCTMCGDCITGCNVGAKGTLPTNYLAMAKEAGAALFTGVEVEYVLPCPEGGYFVYVRAERSDETWGAKVLFAEAVILAAGVLGSTGILLRSRDRGLAVSPRLGHYFSINGDMLGFGYNTDVRTDIVGFGNHPPPEPGFSVGPGILCYTDYRSHKTAGALDFIIQDGAIPRALAPTVRKGAPIAAAVDGEDTDSGLLDTAAEISRVTRDLVSDSPKGALNHTAIFLAMGHDGADGRVILDHRERPKVVWGALADRRVFEGIYHEMRDLTAQLGGTFLPAPKWTVLLGDVPMTVHPLGGCPMGESDKTGVVDPDGRVFRLGSTCHEGLLVADGAIMPTSLGVNPFFTIAALAERISDRFDASRVVNGVRQPVVPRSGPIPEAPVVTLNAGVDFNEKMRGFLSRDLTTAKTPEQFLEAESRGLNTRHGCEISLTMIINDIDKFIGTHSHAAEAVGYVDTEMFGKKRPVDRGLFNLFIQDEATGEKRMIYELVFFGADRQKYLLAGFKVIRDDAGPDLLTDVTTLFTTIHRGGGKDGPIVAQGILRIPPDEIASLVESLEARHPSGVGDELVTLGKLGRFFFGGLWDTYFSRSRAVSET